MIYSNACEYAIRALTLLAEEPPGARLLRSAMAESGELPAPFLGKVLHDLVRVGLLSSVRGRGGGYRLERRADEIRLIDIKEAIDGLSDLEACAVGLDPCSDETPCPLHEDFKRVRETIREYLTNTTLEHVASGVKKKKMLLANER